LKKKYWEEGSIDENSTDENDDETVKEDNSISLTPLLTEPGVIIALVIKPVECKVFLERVPKVASEPSLDELIDRTELDLLNEKDLDITILAEPYHGLVNRSGSDRLKEEEVATIKAVKLIQKEEIMDAIQPVDYHTCLPTNVNYILFGQVGHILNQRPRNPASVKLLQSIYSRLHPPSRERDKDLNNVANPKPSHAVAMDRSGTDRSKEDEVGMTKEIIPIRIKSKKIQPEKLKKVSERTREPHQEARHEIIHEEHPDEITRMFLTITVENRLILFIRFEFAPGPTKIFSFLVSSYKKTEETHAASKWPNEDQTILDRYPLLCNRSSAILIIEKLTKSCLGGLLQRCSTFIQQFTRPKSLRLKDLSKYTTNNQDEKDEPMIKIGCIMSYFRSISGVDPIATTRHPFEILSQLIVHSRFHRSQPVDPIAIPRRPFELLFGETLVVFVCVWSPFIVTRDRRFQPNQPLRHYDDSVTDSRTPIDIVYSLVRRIQPIQPMRHYDDLSTDFETPIDIVHSPPIERKDIPRPKARQKQHNNLHPMMHQTNKKDDKHKGPSNQLKRRFKKTTDETNLFFVIIKMIFSLLKLHIILVYNVVTKCTPIIVVFKFNYVK